MTSALIAMFAHARRYHYQLRRQVRAEGGVSSYAASSFRELRRVYGRPAAALRMKEVWGENGDLGRTDPKLAKQVAQTSASVNEAKTAVEGYGRPAAACV